ncbi:MAG: hypothetical protein RLZZ532_2752, partial [Cyanobacteriota bacterium]
MSRGLWGGKDFSASEDTLTAKRIK